MQTVIREKARSRSFMESITAQRGTRASAQAGDCACLLEEGSAKQATIFVVLVDDDPSARQALRSILQTGRHIEVVGEAASGKEVLETVAQFLPQAVLMDIHMQVMDSLETVRRIKARYPAIAVIMLADYEDEELLAEAIRAGASGCILKNSTRELLHYTIVAAINGGLLIDPSLVVRGLLGMGSRCQGEEAPLGALTPRELEVLRLLSQGHTNREIGATLYLAEITIKKHVQNIMAKLNALDRTHAAVKAYRYGLIR